MTIKRRDFIWGAAALSLGACVSSFARSPAVLDDSPEVGQFKNAQQKLLDKYGVSARSQYLKLAKPKLTAHILEAGQGDPVLMLHGGGAFAAQFAPLMGVLQNDFHLFAPDRPGCGLTDRFNYSGISFRQHAVDFVLSVLDNLKISRISLVGNSMGGYWALLFALAHPERVTKLALIGEPAGSSPPGIQPTPHPANNNPSMQAIQGLYKYMLVANADRVPSELFEAALAAAKLPGAAIAWNSMIEQFKNQAGLGTYALRPELKDLQTETLFIWGGQDKFGLPKMGQEMASIVPRGRCEVVNDAGHIVWLDQLERCASLVKEFLKNQG